MLMEEDMASRSSDSAADRPPILSSAEIDELLSMTLIANLATLDQDDVSTSCPCGSYELVTTYAFQRLAIHTSTGTSERDQTRP